MKDLESVRQSPGCSFYTKDHPEANGRLPKPGEHAYKLTFPLMDGSSLDVYCGDETLRKFADFIGRMVIDDAAEEEK